MQNLLHREWTHGHYVNCVIVFGADERIQICVINTPGTWHDITQSGHGVYVLVQKVCDDHDATIVVDTYSCLYSTNSCNKQ